jgi:hypothetical protein
MKAVIRNCALHNGLTLLKLIASAISPGCDAAMRAVLLRGKDDIQAVATPHGSWFFHAIKMHTNFFRSVLKLFLRLPKSFAVEAVWLDNRRRRWAAPLVPMLLQGECGYENL